MEKNSEVDRWVTMRVDELASTAAEKPSSTARRDANRKTAIATLSTVRMVRRLLRRALLITSPDQHLLLWLHSCFFGLTWGARGPAITAKTADLFPGPNLGVILGVISIGTGAGAGAGAWLAGFVFDMTGTYRVAFWLAIFFYMCGSVAFWSLRRPPAVRGAG